eukprot:TRINITY_DN10637_c0_g1_i1.p1 TRINITY_DN10637_c0_g1~~TRINITY_DN10637_c0_g1_i1.p1  ORF type:complete len:558 (+),score=122.15 TRINITY_DN10637_c0_g1_i1:196-1869(+)
MADEWAPSLRPVLLTLLTVQILSASFNYNTVSDCDEVFNYWEPTHYLTYKYGFQTWEYSPEFGLRSYAYILLHASIAKLVAIFSSDKTFVFYCVRLFMGFVTSSTQTFFYSTVVERFGPFIGVSTFIILLFSPGFFIAGTAMLPSTFSMWALTVAFGAWFIQLDALAVFSVALSTIMGWPFSVVMTFPLVLDILKRRGLIRVFFWGVLSLIFFLGPMMVIDYEYYKKVIIAPLNIIIYNVFSSHGGPELYGVEPWYFYILNGILNFNIMFILAFASVPLLTLRHFLGKSVPKLAYLFLSPMYVWFFLMIRMPHKEERFLFCIYPIIAFAAGFSLVLVKEIMTAILRAITPRSTKIQSINYVTTAGTAGILIVFVLLSLSRTISMVVNYGGPLHVYSHLYHTELRGGSAFGSDEKIRICVGKEWYRFPSNFFLPAENFELSFLESSFKGQLPKLFSKGPDATSIIPTGFNDLNQQEMDRYVYLSQCHYLVDYEFPDQSEDRYSTFHNWKVIYKSPFLDANSSDRLSRAFWIPFYSNRHNTYRDYLLMRNVNRVRLPEK